jgi:hypothetical protein
MRLPDPLGETCLGVEKYIDLFYNWVDLENSYALLDEKKKHARNRSPPWAVFLPFLFVLFPAVRPGSLGGHDPHREKG